MSQSEESQSSSESKQLQEERKKAETQNKMRTQSESEESESNSNGNQQQEERKKAGTQKSNCEHAVSAVAGEGDSRSSSVSQGSAGPVSGISRDTGQRDQQRRQGQSSSSAQQHSTAQQQAIPSSPTRREGKQDNKHVAALKGSPRDNVKADAQMVSEALEYVTDKEKKLFLDQRGKVQLVTNRIETSVPEFQGPTVQCEACRVLGR